MEGAGCQLCYFNVSFSPGLASTSPYGALPPPSLLPSSLPPSFPHKPLCDDDGVIVTGRSALFLLVKITNSQPKIIVQRFEDFPTSI